MLTNPNYIGVADVATATDYAPFGMQLFGRTYSTGSGKYRYGFNGKERDVETGSTTTYDYGFRIYNPALGRFLSVDPLINSYPFYTPYQFAGNKPINSIDLDGLEEKIVIHWVEKKHADGCLKITNTSVKINKDGGWFEVDPVTKKPNGRVYGITETYYYFYNDNKIYKGKDLLELNTADGPKPSANYDYTQKYPEGKDEDDTKYTGTLWNPLNWAKYGNIVKRDANAPDNATTVEDVTMGVLAFSSTIGVGTAKSFLKSEGVSSDALAASSLNPNRVPFKAFNEMNTAEMQAFNHAISRHGADFGLKWGKNSTLPTVLEKFNQAASNIRINGKFMGVKEVQYGVKGSGKSSTKVKANVYEHMVDGKNFYYHETLDGKFISAGLKTIP